MVTKLKSTEGSILGFLVRDKKEPHQWSVMMFPIGGETIQADLRPATVRQLQARYEVALAAEQIFETMEIITLKPAPVPKEEVAP